jgi:hypothetical protein
MRIRDIGAHLAAFHKTAAEHHGRMAAHEQAQADDAEKCLGKAAASSDLHDCMKAYVQHHTEKAAEHTAMAEHHLACCEECSKATETELEKFAANAELAAEVETLSTEFAKLRDTIKPAEISRVVPDVPVFAVTRQGSRGIETNVDPHWRDAMGLNE